MNQQIKQQWTAALRSGTYQQTYGYLHTDAGYCVLGVLCDLHRQATNADNWTYVEKHYGPRYDYLDNEYALPQAVSQWAEISEDVEMEVGRQNDKQKRSFKAIASYIDDNL